LSRRDFPREIRNIRASFKCHGIAPHSSQSRTRLLFDYFEIVLPISNERKSIRRLVVVQCSFLIKRVHRFGRGQTSDRGLFLHMYTVFYTAFIFVNSPWLIVEMYKLLLLNYPSRVAFWKADKRDSIELSLRCLRSRQSR